MVEVSAVYLTLLNKHYVAFQNVWLDRDFFKGGGGVVLNVNFKKGYFCTDLGPNTLYRKCIKFAPKKGRGGGFPTPSTPPPLPTPPLVVMKCQTSQFGIIIDIV